MIALIWAVAILVAVTMCLLFLAVMVISIHRVDRAKSLLNGPRGRIDVVTRRVLGVRAFSMHHEGRHS